MREEEKKPAMFSSNEKGFCITFANGYSFSVQWNKLNYCDNKTWKRGKDNDAKTCINAEVAYWKRDSKDMTIEGYQTPEEVSALMEKVANF